MSVAANFKYYRPFPSCPEVIDFTSIDWADFPYQQIFVRGLTLEEAMALYWNWESVTFAYSLSGVNSGGHAAASSWSGALTQDEIKEPSERVCAVTHFVYSGSDAAGETWDGTDIPLSVTVDMSPWNYPGIYQEPDESYVISFTLGVHGDYTALGGGGTDGIDTGIGGAKLATYQDVSIGGGTARIYGYCLAGYDGDASGTLSSLTLTPTFYTYA